ncbi:uncharacterized protein LOC106757947 [Vigna radiata var. radiata]|uniref:Uncharacterized protein LOC106757947 n=1 Tax=Vigna radiata var. radiata TaxID=3916 RepID=A0A1S3TRA3_VIGRR|nr:uncharacterized protein LOC106757947 [Vigna radiata var. radiata]
MEVHIPDTFTPPVFKMYDGSSDPEGHIKSFTNAMAFRTGVDAIWCWAFSLSLEGEALEWFNSLPNNSIENFDGISRMFKKQFAACKTQDVTIVDLMNLRQGKEETLRTFMDRFQKIVRRVKGLTVELALQSVLSALRPGPFKESICRTPPTTMKELRERTADEIRVENMKLGEKDAATELKEDKTDSRKADFPNNKHRTGGPRDLPRQPKFQQYTPLNAPRAKILQEALSAQALPPPRSRPTPSGADHTKHCLYHKNMGHSTEECITLRDKIEELIRAGHLKEFIRVEKPDREERIHHRPPPRPAPPCHDDRRPHYDDTRYRPTRSDHRRIIVVTTGPAHLEEAGHPLKGNGAGAGAATVRSVASLIPYREDFQATDPRPQRSNDESAL